MKVKSSQLFNGLSILITKPRAEPLRKSGKKISFEYLLTVIMVVIFTWIIHEFAHWLTSNFLGYESIMKLNGVSTVKAVNKPDWHKLVISGSGPVITILQAITCFLFLKKRRWKNFLYALLFTAFYMRFLAGLMTFITVNDEGRISAYFNIGTFTLPVIVSGFLFYIVYNISQQYRLNWKFQTGTALTVIIASSILILTDQILHIRLL